MKLYTKVLLLGIALLLIAVFFMEPTITKPVTLCNDQGDCAITTFVEKTNYWYYGTLAGGVLLIVVSIGGFIGAKSSSDAQRTKRPADTRERRNN